MKPEILITKLYLIVALMTVLAYIHPGMAQSQNKGIHLSTSVSGYYASGNDLPFWFTSNQQGIFEQVSNHYVLANLSFIKALHEPDQKKWDYTFGVRGVGARGTNSFFQFNEWYAGLRYDFIQFKIGAWPEETCYHGLSSTNGDINWSNNARPMPRVRLSTNGFIPIPFLKKWYFKAVYDEGLFNDERYVKDAHLHHKYLYIRKPFNPNTALTFGVDHYSMWGGTSPEQGELPGFDSYLRYVFALKGTNKFNESDQGHVAGNALGAYYLKLEQYKTNGKMTWYINHPFDDRVTMQNFRDNLYGVVFESNEKKILSSYLFEIMYTNNQNVIRDENGNSKRPFHEDYFRHGTYRSGFTYDYRMIASPFFTPLVIINGVNLGTGNNRILLFHAGLEGYLNNRLHWKTLISFSSNKGTFAKIYDQVIPGFFDHWREQVSILGEINYQCPGKGWDISCSLAFDKGEMLEDQLGVKFSIRKSVSF